MPGRDYTEAFARLSPTIQDIFQTHEPQYLGQEPEQASTDLPLPWQGPVSFTQHRELPYREIKQSNEQPAASIPTQNPSIDLPPTPPQNAPADEHSSDNNSSSSIIEQHSGVTATSAADVHETSPKALSGVSTPTNKKSLPTPDVTPPSAVQEPRTPLNLGSSLSFQTAREDPMLSMRQSFDSSAHALDESKAVPLEPHEVDEFSLRRGSEKSDAFDLVGPGDTDLFPEVFRRTPSLKNRPDVKALVGHWERESKRYSIVSDTDTSISNSRPRNSEVSPQSPIQNDLRWGLGLEWESHLEDQGQVEGKTNGELANKVFDLSYHDDMQHSFALPHESKISPIPIYTTEQDISHANGQPAADEDSLSQMAQSNSPPQKMANVIKDAIHQRRVGTSSLHPTTHLRQTQSSDGALIDIVPGLVPTPDTSILRGNTPERVKTDMARHDPQSEEPSPLTAVDLIRLRNGPKSEEPSPITPAENQLGKLTHEIIRYDKERKFSNTSSPASSRTTIVNAIVVDPRANSSLPKLRHVSKTASLRGAASESDKSNRNSLNSVGSTTPPPHRLIRKKNITPERRVRYFTDPRPDEGLTGLHLFNDSHLFANRPRTAPERYDSPLGVLRRTPKKNENMRESVQLGSKALKRLSDPLHSQTLSSAMNPDRLSKTGSSEIPIIFEGHPDLENLRDISREPRQRNGELPSSRSISRDPDSTNASPLIARFSADRSSIVTESLPRPSLEQAGPVAVQESNSAHSHQVYKLASPITLHSNFSGLEVHEATAVSIYPHTNSSLLMVHHNAWEDPLEVQLSSSKSQTTISKAVIKMEPSTPDQARLLAFPELRDSPLMNPRAAPEPPTLAVIPPTPAQDIDEADVVARRPSNSRPNMYNRGSQRSSTLINRARRYSGSVLHPIVSSFGAGNLTRTNTRARYYYGNSAKRIPSASERGNNSNLHPLWRPRHFWEDEADGLDDVQDDETNDRHEAYDDENRYDNRFLTGGRKAPDGPELQKHNNNSHWRRGGSLRGFLIGNTLGLERGPTNRRRHVVALPPGMKGIKGQKRAARAAARAKAAAKSTTAATSSSPASIVTVRDSVRRSGSGRGQRHGGSRRGVNSKPLTLGAKWPFKSWKGMIEQRQQRQMARHEEENL